MALRSLARSLRHGQLPSDYLDQVATVVTDLDGVARLGDRLAVSVNLEVAEPGTVLAEGDEVALLPPVSGG